MGLIDKLHHDLFNAIHQQRALDPRVLARDPKPLFDWVASKGVDRQKFVDTYNSFAVSNRTQRASDLTRNYDVPHTPVLVVDGRYLTSPSMKGNARRRRQRRLREVLRRTSTSSSRWRAASRRAGKNRSPRMNRRRTLLLALPSVPLAAFTGAPHSPQEPPRARQNIEYRLIEPPQPIETGDRIEVIDFFWYGCPYCNQLLPFLEAWIKRKPSDVTVRRIPAILKDTWAPHARIYYTLELLNEVERLHRQRLPQLPRGRAAHEQARRHGAVGGQERHRPRKWVDAYFSPEVDGKIARAAARHEALHRRGNALARRGRPLHHLGQHGAVDQGMVVVLDDLVRIARQRRGAK